jgi:xylan 1,4-beta-xylosidase
VSTVLAQGTAPATVQLRLTAAQGHLFSFASSADGGATWQPIGSMVDDSALPPWDRGVRVALTAAGPVGASASFESFRLVTKNSR